MQIVFCILIVWVLVNKKDQKIISTNFANEKHRDFKFFQKSKLKINKNIKILADSCYQGIERFHENTYLSRKK